MSERGKKLREMVMEIVGSPGFGESMRSGRKEYTKKNPEDPANGH